MLFIVDLISNEFLSGIINLREMFWNPSFLKNRLT